MFDIEDKIPMLSSVELNAIFLLGLILFVGVMGARSFQKLRLPQVVGYIIVGIILGQAGLNIINKGIIETFVPFNYFALGIIGFTIGGELNKEVFRRYGKQFAIILLAEGLAAFLIVSILIGVLGTFILGNSTYAWALGLLLGAIASATAPAVTTNVLWEYKARGPLTTTVMGIVAFDDGMALILFALASSIAAVILGANPSLSSAMSRAVYEIGMGIFVGLTVSLSLIQILRKYAEKDKILVFSLCSILFALGLALIMKIDLLLVAMTMGVVLVNKEPRLSRDVFKLVSGFAMPFYILFFVLVGAKFDFQSTTLTVIAIVFIYLLSRTLGKMAGAFWGAKISGASKTVQKYLPFCLLGQAGVAIGLSILAYQNFPGIIGESIVIIVTFATFASEIVAPPCVRYAVVKAQEAGLNISEDDILSKTKVGQIMDKNPTRVYENTPLRDILDIFSKSSYNAYPVVNRGNTLKGIITIEGIRKAFAYIEIGTLIIAHDIMEPVVTKQISPNSFLLQAEEVMDKYGIYYMPVVNARATLEGFIEKKDIHKFVYSKLIEVKKNSDSAD